MTNKKPSELKVVSGKYCATSAVIIRDNKILLGLRHYPPEKLNGISVWTTPGGRCNEGEIVGENLRRETLEETGISNLKVMKFLGLIPSAVKKVSLYVFLCETVQEPQRMEPEKFSEWKWFNLSEIPENFINDGIPPLIH